MSHKERTVEELLFEINNLPNIDFRKDPDFVADYMIGSVIEAILRELDNQGISKVEFAAKLGKSRQYISKILNEKNNLTIKSLAQISCALDCNLEISLKNNLSNSGHKGIYEIDSTSQVKEYYDSETTFYPDKKCAKLAQKINFPSTSDYGITRDTGNQRDLAFYHETGVGSYEYFSI